MKQTMFTAALVIAAIVAGGAIARAAQANRVDVTGVWIFTVESQAGKSNPNVTFTQAGEKLTGKYSSQLMGDVDLAGTVRGQTIEFAISANVQGAQIELKYSGTVESKDSMKGTLSAGEFGAGTFTAVRK